MLVDDDDPWRIQKIVFAGAGAAGVGIGNMIKMAMIEEGCPPVVVEKALLYVDSKGLLTEMAPRKESYKHDVALSAEIMKTLGFTGKDSYHTT